MGLLDDIKNYDVLANEAKQNIREVYLSDQRPWVIGYSGGKDSTTVLQLVIETLLEMQEEKIPLNKMVYVISSDTMVETPLIIARLDNSLRDIENFVLEKNLPVETHLVRPEINNTFWVNLIGKGYPVPNQSFRWCTDRMKIDPTNKFIKNTISKYGEVIVLLGVREGESTSRDRVIAAHNIEGKLIMQHSSLANAFTFAPIKKFEVDDVWNYLLNHRSPWGFDNEELFKMYADSNANECPLIIDKETKERNGSCGNSRFGCWVCTVVNEDKALTGFVENGEEWLRPLVNYRNWLRKNRDNRSMRMKTRANGSVYLVKIPEKDVDGGKILTIPKKSGREKVVLEVNDNQIVASNGEHFDLIKEEALNSYLREHGIDLTKGENPNLIIQTEDKYCMLGLGPYTFEARFEMLERLLIIQREFNEQGRNYDLITEKELKEIRREWFKRGLIEDQLPVIYAQIFDRDINWEQNDMQLLSEQQFSLLNQLCQAEGVHISPMVELLHLEKVANYGNFKKSNMDEINEILTKDYLHY